MARAYKGVRHLTGSQRPLRAMQYAKNTNTNGAGLVARFDGKCVHCKIWYSAGQRIYNIGDGWGHADCAQGVLAHRRNNDGIGEINESRND